MKHVSLKKHLVSLLVALAVLATACGSSTTDDTTSSANEGDVTEADADTDAEVETTTTTIAETTTSEETTTTTEAPEADPVQVSMEYCEAVVEVDEVLDAADFLDPIQLEDALTTQVDTMSAVDAPAEIEADIATMIDVSAEYLEILDGADFDITLVEDEITELFGRPEIEAATANIDAFELENCPQVVEDEFEPAENEFGLTEEDVIALLDNPAGREGIVEGIVSSTPMTTEEASCFLDNTDPTVVAALFSIGVGAETTIDPAVASGMIEGLAACDLAIDAFG